MICEWEDCNNYRHERRRDTFHTHIAKFGVLEAEMKNLTTDHRGNGIYSTKMLIFEARRQVDAHVIMGFTGAAWSHVLWLGYETWNTKQLLHHSRNLGSVMPFILKMLYYLKEATAGQYCDSGRFCNQ